MRAANTPACGYGAAHLQGHPGDHHRDDGSDVRSGNLRRDVIVGLGGNDKLSGLAGNDLIRRPGNDKLNGGPGKDKQVQ